MHVFSIVSSMLLYEHLCHGIPFHCVEAFGDLCVCVRTIVWSEESLIHNISSMCICLSWILRYSVDLWAEFCPLVSKRQPTHHEHEPDIDAVASHTSCPPDPVHTQYITLPSNSGKGDLLCAGAETVRIYCIGFWTCWFQTLGQHIVGVTQKGEACNVCTSFKCIAWINR